MIRIFLLVLVSFALANGDSFGQSFPFTIPGSDSSETITSQAGLLHKPAGKHGFVKVKGDHFYAGDQRIRFWGMNLCFSANFPTHEVADQLAPHLAKLGVNAVRFHHMDTQSAPSGIWDSVDADGVRALDPEMVDRLDYLMAKLHENGVYANLNLHTGRTLTAEEGFPQLNDAPWWAASNKWVMYYDKSVQATVKKYCHDLLTHKNPYRENMRRTDDPGVAMLEMLNENYFTVKGYSLAHKLPQRFQDSLREAWNDWLVKKYTSTEAMTKVWLDGRKQQGAFLVGLADWTTELGGWGMNKPSAGMPYSLAAQPPEAASNDAPNSTNVAKAIRIEPNVVTEKDFKQQLYRTGMDTQKGQPLTLTYWVRADSDRQYRIEFSTYKDDRWRDLGENEDLTATPQWQKVQRTIFPTETISGDANLLFSFGNSKVPIEFAWITLRQGASAQKLGPKQRIETGSVPVPTSSSPMRAHEDMTQFMVDTEVAWVTELKSYVKDDLGAKVPITASQINYHTPEINVGTNDFVDLHNYWHHPLFPSDAPWSAERWTVESDPMEAAPTSQDWPANNLLMRMGWRVAGKPMTLSEWNVSEPSYSSAGCVPMAAVLASLQDWDAIFFFDYDSTSQDTATWNRSAAINFFDFNGQPVKLATFSVFANVFLRGDLPALQQKLIAPIDQPIDGTLALTHWLGVSNQINEVPKINLPNPRDLRTTDGSITWQSTPPKQGLMTINTPNTQGFWGTISGQSCDTSDLQVKVDSVDPNYGLVVATSTDGQPIAKAKSILLLAATSSKNTNMKWNEERNSVGKSWGEGPTQVAAMKATIDLKNIVADVYALDGTGKRTTQIATSSEETSTQFSISESQKTLWYEVVPK